MSEQEDTETERTSVRIEEVAASLSGEALTFNAEAPDEELAVDAVYVTLTPTQAQRLRRWFLQHGGEERQSHSKSDDHPLSRSFQRAWHQSGSAAETASFVADQLPDDDPRQAKAQEAADLLSEVAESLFETRQSALNDE